MAHLLWRKLPACPISRVGGAPPWTAAAAGGRRSGLRGPAAWGPWQRPARAACRRAHGSGWGRRSVARHRVRKRRHLNFGHLSRTSRQSSWTLKAPGTNLRTCARWAGLLRALRGSHRPACQLQQGHTRAHLSGSRAMLTRSDAPVQVLLRAGDLAGAAAGLSLADAMSLAKALGAGAPVRSMVGLVTAGLSWAPLRAGWAGPGPPERSTTGLAAAAARGTGPPER